MFEAIEYSIIVNNKDMFYAIGDIKMKILITTDTYKPTVNGVVTSILNLKYGLEALGHDVKILTLSKTTDSHEDDEVYYMGSLDMSQFYPDVRVRHRRGTTEVNQLMHWKPDIIHTHSELSTFSIARRLSRRLNVPLVHTYHTMYENYTHYFSFSKRVGRQAVRRLTHHVSTSVDMIIAPSEKIREMLLSYEVMCPISVIPSGISLRAFEEGLSQDECKRARNQLNIPLDHILLASVSRIGKEKNIEELIRYMNHLKGEKISLVIVGDGPYKNELEHLVRQLGLTNQIKFTGMIDSQEIARFYQIADLFVSASTSETQGLTYVEALASGTPLLCKEDECLNGLLKESENGFSFQNEAQFFDKLNQFRQVSDKTLLSVNAKEIAKQYSTEAYVNHVLQLYENLIATYQ